MLSQRTAAEATQHFCVHIYDRIDSTGGHFTDKTQLTIANRSAKPLVTERRAQDD